MSWKAFVEMVTSHENCHEGPLRLNSLHQEKYSGIHASRKLLSDHQEALCKEPRDKICDLVGLAADTIGCPMDYNKFLIEVWADTMEFWNREANSEPLEQALPLNYFQSLPAIYMEDPEKSHPKVFRLKGYVVGCIVAIGPFPTEILSSMQKADQSDSEILQNFPKDLGEARRENDTLMHHILEAKMPS
ncbi:hypothetical protein ACHAPF_000145 [Botrytis cinerea]